MSTITGVVNVDNTLTGVEDLFLDELDVTNVVADVIELGGSDLQTTITNLQNQITNAGGFFTLTCEFNGNSTNGGHFAFGAGSNSSLLSTLLPDCICIAFRAESQTNVLGNGSVVFQKNGVAVTSLGAGFTTGIRLVQNLNRNISFVLGDVISIRFNNAGSNMFGGGWRVSYVFKTAAITGSNGSNGTNGQNVSFNVPTISTITPITTPSINDTITTASGTQTHSLNFNIPRGKNSSFQVGTISSVGTASPSLNITGATDANGDNLFTMNFGLQQGIQGQQGQKGDKGDQGDEANSTFLAALSATAAGISAGLAAGSATSAAGSAITASGAGAQAGAQAGAEAAEAVLDGLETRVTILEGEMDTQQTKTQFISQSATETFIGGSKTIINSTLGLLTNVLEADSLNISTTINTNNLNVTGDTNFAGDILMADTKKLLTNIINQRQHPAAGDILINANNLDIGSSFCDSIDLQGDAINITTNDAAGFTTFNCTIVDTDTQVLVEGSLEAKNLIISNNATINNNLLVDQNLTAGTDGDLNEHTLYGTLFTQTIEGIDNVNPLNIGGDTNELQILSNNIAIGNLDVAIASTTTMNNNTISIGENVATTLVSIGNTDSKISCNGTTDTITMDTTNLIIDTTETDINGDITLGNSIDANTNILIQNRNINIGTTQIGMTVPTLNMGTYNRTITEIRGETIEILASETTSINGSSNLVLDATAIDIGNSSGDVNIQGSTIDIGTAGIANVINIGNNFSSVTINTIDTEFINVDNFFNQIGF